MARPQHRFTHLLLALLAAALIAVAPGLLSAAPPSERDYQHLALVVPKGKHYIGWLGSARGVPMALVALRPGAWAEPWVHPLIRGMQPYLQDPEIGYNWIPQPADRANLEARAPLIKKLDLMFKEPAHTLAAYALQKSKKGAPYDLAACVQSYPPGESGLSEPFRSVIHLLHTRVFERPDFPSHLRHAFTANKSLNAKKLRETRNLISDFLLSAGIEIVRPEFLDELRKMYLAYLKQQKYGGDRSEITSLFTNPDRRLERDVLHLAFLHNVLDSEFIRPGGIEARTVYVPEDARGGPRLVLFNAFSGAIPEALIYNFLDYVPAGTDPHKGLHAVIMKGLREAFREKALPKLARSLSMPDQVDELRADPWWVARDIFNVEREMTVPHFEALAEQRPMPN